MATNKREAALKNAFSATLRARAPRFVTQRFATRGAPDRVIAGNGRVTFWEFKHGTPGFESNNLELQLLTCRKLDAESYCRFVIWQETETGEKRTLIATPRAVSERSGHFLIPEAFVLGFDHKWLVNFILRVHG